MPSTCHLPVEILLKIFNHIKEKSHLVQYRLVCKTWASAANMAMLRHIDATDADKVMKLYHYLAANPNLSLHVRYIDNLKYIKWKDPTFDEFLTVVMTPNLRAIEGRFNTHEMSILLNNVRRTQLESLKMERLPIAKVFNDTYASLLLHFKATLTSLYFDLCRRTTQLRALNLICSKLDQFHNLTDLTVRDMLKYLATVQELDSMLKGCTRLVNLTLIISQEKVKRRLNELQLKEWLSREVQEAASMKSIHIKYMPANAAIVSSNYSRHQNDLLQYLSFKYPNVEQMYIDDYGQIKAGISHSVFDNRINVLHLKDWKVQRIDDINSIILALKSQDNSLTIKFKEDFGIYPSNYKMSIYRDKQKDLTNVSISIQPMAYERDPQDILSRLNASGFTVTKGLDIDCVEFGSRE